MPSLPKDSQRLLWGVLGGGVAVVLVWLAWPDSQPKKASQLAWQAAPSLNQADITQSPAPVSLAFISEKLKFEGEADNVNQRLMTRRSAAGYVFTSQQEMEQARQQPLLFVPTAASSQDVARSPLSNSRRLQDGRLWIDYNMRVLGSRVEGDTFILPLPGSSDVKCTIDSVEFVNGQYRWQGSVRDLSAPGRFSITQSFEDGYAVGSITVGQQEFLLEAKSGLGWVAPTSKEFQLPPNGEDYLHAAPNFKNPQN